MKLLAILLVAITLLLVLAPTLNATFAMGKKDAKAKKEIINGIARAAEGKWRSIDMINISKVNSSSVITIYNKTITGVITQPPDIVQPPPVINQTEPQVCNIKEHLENGTCVPDVIIPPTPATNETVSTTTKVCLVGDLEGNTVPNLMRINGCDLKIGLGDLGYQSDLSWFKSLKFDKCVIGNHDAAEDGSSSIEKEALAYCGDHWAIKPNNSTVIIGLNTNDGAGSVSFVRSAIDQAKTVILLSHKGGHVPPNSHHPAEASALYKQLEAVVPSNVKLFEIAGHNHVSSSAPSKNWYIAGAGGKSFYTCGTDSTWTFCDNKNEGYLELTINNATTTAKFIK